VLVTCSFDRSCLCPSNYVNHNVVRYTTLDITYSTACIDTSPARPETDFQREGLSNGHLFGALSPFPRDILGVVSAQSNSASDCPTQLPPSKDSSEAPPTGCRHLHSSNTRSHDAVTSCASGPEGWHGRRRRPVRSHHTRQLFSRPGAPHCGLNCIANCIKC
jgi:hypothetical protein